MRQLTPREIIAELDAHIVGQMDAKRAVAIAVRNRWRRQQLPEDLRMEISPKNILMIGPTGVGKTEIARRLAKLTGAPFVKVEATKYTEVGYYGRDVESMIRELVESAIGLVRSVEREKILAEAQRKVEEKLLDLLVPLSSKKKKETTSSAGSSGGKTLRIEGVLPKEMLGPLTEMLQKISSAAGKDANGKTLEETIPFQEMLNGTITIQPGDLPPELQRFIESLPSEKGQEDAKNNVLDEADSDEIDSDVEDSDVEDSDVEDSDVEDSNVEDDESETVDESARLLAERLRENLREKLRRGELDTRLVEVPVKSKAVSPLMMMNLNNDMMDTEMAGVLDRLMPQRSVVREMTVKEARQVLLEAECNAMINEDKVNVAAIEMAESTGIIFLDEIDKIVASENSRSADVSRQGVQRDLLPIVEGTTVQTRYGYVRTDHILFIAAGAFHRNKPSDLMPELQGRFPIRVELKDLTQEDFARILREPKNSLPKQYEALLKTEGVTVIFEDEAIDVLAAYAWKVNQTSQNIGARRLYTVLERLLEELSFEASEIGQGQVRINAAYVHQRLSEVAEDEDLSRYIL